jgi:tRNA (adenine37-N6)-methyltransferase
MIRQRSFRSDVSITLVRNYMKLLTFIHTPFKEKFGVPKQSLLVEEAWGKMIFTKDDFFSEAFRGIEKSTHLWLIFEFHLVEEANVKALVRPPKFEGKEKWGVFATRSPHRPNRLGLSVVKFERLEFLEKEIHLWVSGVDLVDGTPILDIKPYIPYVDRVEGARSEMFERPVEGEILWKCEAPSSRALIEKVVALDPRPGHDRKTQESFGVSIGGYNVRFEYIAGVFEILECVRE